MKFGYIWLLLNLLLFLSGCSKNSLTSSDKEPIVPDTPQEMIGQMLRGINLGNTLEPPAEGEWNNGPAQEYYFDDYKSAGFTCVRIPVKWGSHTSSNPPYAIDPAWINRVEQVVNWGLKKNLYIIINGHHEDWLKQSYTRDNIARYDSIWKQISERFKDKSRRLLFEIINEPFGMSTGQVDDLNFRILAIIRQSNPTRVVIYSGRDYSGLDYMIEAAVPQDDYLMAYFHSYDPWSFAGEGNGFWGTTADREKIKSMFEKAASWSGMHNIPVMVSEFGAVRTCDYTSRMLHYNTYTEEAIRNNIAFQAWDDGGDFGIYDRNARTWPEVKDILTKSDPAGPTLITTTIEGEAAVLLTWQNRTSMNSSIVIERGTGNTDFAEITRLAADATEYHDSNVVSNGVYYYRVIAVFSNQPDMYSYPVKVIVYLPPAG